MTDALATRRAVEALRSGVPNRSVVRVLGCRQAEAKERFSELAARTKASGIDNLPVAGFVMRGRFGAGKSHLLDYFASLAVDQNFVCSKVVIGKETPLHDMRRVFAAAIESAEAPNVHGLIVDEVVHRLDPRSEEHARLYRWANGREAGEMPALFPATLKIQEELSGDTELMQKIASFWAGERISIQDVKAGLKRLGQEKNFDVKSVSLRALPLHHFRFASALFRAYGFAGWILCFDEVEQISKYSLLQRAGAYAEIARWLGRSSEEAIPGVGCMLAVTDDFAPTMFEDKLDHEKAPARLRQKGDAFSIAAANADSGIRALRRPEVTLEGPTGEDLRAAFGAVRELYERSYGWTPPDADDTPPSTDKPMRIHVRRWVNSWDIRRLYGESAQPQTIEEERREDYEEDPDIGSQTEESMTEDRLGASN